MCLKPLKAVENKYLHVHFDSIPFSNNISAKILKVTVMLLFKRQILLSSSQSD